MHMSDLQQLLSALETELHHPGRLCSRERLGQLLHAEFHEVGRSGRAYDRRTVIEYLAAVTTSPPVIPRDFRLALLAPDVALLTYRSDQHGVDGQGSLPTLRSSVWCASEGRWQLRYHQGTPACD